MTREWSHHQLLIFQEICVATVALESQGQCWQKGIQGKHLDVGRGLGQTARYCLRKLDSKGEPWALGRWGSQEGTRFPGKNWKAGAKLKTEVRNPKTTLASMVREVIGRKSQCDEEGGFQLAKCWVEACPSQVAMWPECVTYPFWISDKVGMITVCDARS